MSMESDLEKIKDRQFLLGQGKLLLGGVAGVLLYAVGMNLLCRWVCTVVD